MSPTATLPARDQRDPVRLRTQSLLMEAHQAEPDRRASLHDQVIALNMARAAALSRRYRGRGIPDDDLEQVAYLGLVKAVHGFDPYKASDFFSYAVPTIRGELRRHFRDLGWTIRPPRRIQELQSKLGDAEQRLRHQLGRSPRPSELAESLNVDEAAVIEALAARGCFTPTSLDAAPGDDGQDCLSDRLGDTDEAFGAAEARAMLAPMLTSLTSRERLILELRFVNGYSQSEIGQRLGVTQTQVSRLTAQLLAKLREGLGTASAA